MILGLQMGSAHFPKKMVYLVNLKKKHNFRPFLVKIYKLIQFLEVARFYDELKSFVLILNIAGLSICCGEQQDTSVPHLICGWGMWGHCRNMVCEHKLSVV